MTDPTAPGPGGVEPAGVDPGGVEPGRVGPGGDTAWFHCFAGVAGDMALGALVDAGADLAEVEALCRRLPVTGWDIEAEPVLRGGLAATKIHVRVTTAAEAHRSWAVIRDLLDTAALPERVRARTGAVFGALARAEGALHRRPPDEVSFHEVGSLDAIVDVVGVCAALEILGVDEVRCSPIAVGRGTVRADHGLLPNPSPAATLILAEVGAPTHGIDSPVELTTPTGAALMAGLAAAFGPLPPVMLRATGFGAGGSDPDGRVNATQVVLGDATALGSGGADWGATGSGQPVALLETNVDDATGEVLADAVAELMAAGAHDAWITPIVMKKGRPAHTVSVLADPAVAADLAAVLRTSTGSIGVRGATLERWPASRSMGEVDVDGHRVRTKISPGRVKAEHDDVVAVARATARPTSEVATRAEAAALASLQTEEARTERARTERARTEEGPAEPLPDGRS